MAVIMVCGFPASGKSTVTNQLSNAPEVVVLNRDTEGGTIAGLLPKLEAHLRDRDDVVLDNLFPTVESRKSFIEMCKKIESNCNPLTDVEGLRPESNPVKRPVTRTGNCL